MYFVLVFVSGTPFLKRYFYVKKNTFQSQKNAALTSHLSFELKTKNVKVGNEL